MIIVLIMIPMMFMILMKFIRPFLFSFTARKEEEEMRGVNERRKEKVIMF